MAVPPAVSVSAELYHTFYNLTTPSSGKSAAGQGYVIYGGANLTGFNVTSFSLSQGFSVSGTIANGRCGCSVDGVGDMNKDGYDDVIIGIDNVSQDGRSYAGVSYVIYGGSNLTNIELPGNLSSLQGFSVTGAMGDDESGSSVSGAGDVNGDGFPDLVIGAEGASPYERTQAGKSYVIYGGDVAGTVSTAAPFPVIINELSLANLTLAEGFSLTGCGPNNCPVSGAGDVNGDGYDDIGIVGSGAGPSYIIYGGVGLHNLMLSVNLTASQGVVMTGGGKGVGSINGAGDVNKDGFADVIIGASNASPNGRKQAGQSYVIYGGINVPSVNLTNMALSQGFSILGAIAGDGSGFSVSSAGDVNKDGFADVIIGAWESSPNNRTQAGASYVVYGGANLTNTDLANFTQSQGFSIAGASAYDNSGRSVSGAGDVNRDGYDDVIVGVSKASPNGRLYAGQSYVIFGGQNLTNIDLSNLTPTQGITILGAITGDATGSWVSDAGDVNKDGYPDIIIGTSGASPYDRSSAGKSYVIYGGANLTNLDLANFSLTQGFFVAGAFSGAQSGHVSGAGDVNKDGYDDIIIGAPGTMGLDGASYVIYGGLNLTNIDLASLPASQGFSMVGLGVFMSDYGSESGNSVSGAGDINGDGYSDVIIGAPDAINHIGQSYIYGQAYVIYGGPGGSTALTTTSTTTATVTRTSTSTTPLETTNITLQSGGRTTSNASSWTGVIVGATVGVVAAIGAGYLAYRKWRGHGKGVAPQIRGAGIAAMNALDQAHEEDLRMQVNPVYEGAPLQQTLRTYEQPHIDTWDQQTYDAVEQNEEGPITKLAAKTIRAAYDTILPLESSEPPTPQNIAFYDFAEPEEQMTSKVMRAADVLEQPRHAYEVPHITTWSPQSYDFIDGNYRPPAYETIAEPQQAWGVGYEAAPFGCGTSET